MSLRKVGGIWFWRVWRVSGSLYITSKRKRVLAHARQQERNYHNARVLQPLMLAYQPTRDV